MSESETRVTMQWTRRSRLLAGTAIAVAAVVGIGALAIARTPLSGPDSPYDHPGFSEKSVAGEQTVAGQASTVVDGLRGLGYWCVQPRRNDRAIQIACRPPLRPEPEPPADRYGDPGPTEFGPVDLVAGPNGDILYADIDLPEGRGKYGLPAEYRYTVWEVLDPSFLLLWPGQRAAVEGLVDQAQPSRLFVLDPDPIAPSDPDDQYETHEERTDTASWSLWSRYDGAPLALRVRTSGLQDNSWPFGGEHYATTLSAAVGRLSNDGFACATSCYRAADDQSVSFEAHGDQIVSATFTLRTVSDDDRVDDRAGEWVRSGLPFLTPAVRDAVSDRIEQQRLAHQGWRGVIAGTPVQIMAHAGASSKNDRPARDLDVMIGIPLLRVDPW